MERFWLPLPSLIGLFSTLLILSPELLLGIPEPLSDVPLTDPGMRKALAFIVEQYNLDRDDSNHYFKMLCVLKAQTQEISRNEYRLTMDLVKTACKKRAGRKRKYKRIQKCKQLPGNRESLTCYFKAFWHALYLPRMALAVTSCTPFVPPNKPVCSG